MKKAFTLIELLVVIIIIAILASIAYTTYRAQMEKSRSAEAFANLGTLSKQAMLYYYEHGSFPVFSAATTDINSNLPHNGTANDCAADAVDFYFNYECDTTGVCAAYRCTSAGKHPSRPSGMEYQYVINVTSGNVTSSGTLP